MGAETKGKITTYSQTSNISTEIVMGIIGPIGCNREIVLKTIKKLAKHFSYKVVEIKVSEIIERYKELKADKEDDFSRVMEAMTAGNDLRKEANDNSILGKMSCVEISKKRINDSDQRTIYVVDSIKRPEEVNALRDTYGKGFYLFAIHSDEAVRDSFLKLHCHISKESDRKTLIDRDKAEDDKDGVGQATRDAFHLADFFLNENGDCQNKVWNVLERYFDLIFGHPFRPPTFQEYAMFMAFSASFKSADLSRQVGAAVTINNDIISTGANECPQAFGGTYWPSFDKETKKIFDQDDGRDYMIGFDYNANVKGDIVDSLMSNIPDEVKGQLTKNINVSGLNDITEYGRVVHAEMDAILSCTRRGVSTHGAIMFCTTFPCHNCAKHIVASGLKTVVYVEPYPKSKAFFMHKDSITDDCDEQDKKVLFRPFVGVGPRQYINAFSMHLSVGHKMRRKVRGGIENIEWEQKNAYPRVKMFDKSYLEIERHLEEEINSKFK